MCVGDVISVSSVSQGQHRRLGRCKKTPERSGRVADVDASIFQRHTKTMEGADSKRVLLKLFKYHQYQFTETIYLTSGSAYGGTSRHGENTSG